MKTLKVGQLVKFNIIQDDSDYASNCFGVEPQNDYFDVQVYTEQVYGEIIKRNTIQRISKDGNKGKIYKITNGVIFGELVKLNFIQSKHNLRLRQIFEDSGLKTLNDFKKIDPVSYIALNKVYKMSQCLTSPPQHSKTLLIWEKVNMGHKAVGQSFYRGGLWHDSTTNEVNTSVNELHFWQVVMDRGYMNGKIFVESPEIKPLVIS